MAAAARLGLPTLYAGPLGTGPFADQARAALVAAGVECALPPRPDLDTGFVVTLVDPSGERTFVTSRGAEATLSAQDLFQPEPDDLVYLSGYSLLHDANRAALIPWLATIPPEIPVFFDPGPLVADIPSTALEPVLHRTTWLSCNTTEATTLTGQADLTAAAETLANRPQTPAAPDTHLVHELSIPPDWRRSSRAQSRPQAVAKQAGPGAGSGGPAPVSAASSTRVGGVLVRVGGDGCLLGVRGGGVVEVAGFAVAAVDLNGAGDAHAGAFLAGIAEGKEPIEAARWANAAAALAVTRRGPATGPSRSELEGFLRAY
jgi:sugar/nucleoside kinase (ribokinase family)